MNAAGTENVPHYEDHEKRRERGGNRGSALRLVSCIVTIIFLLLSLVAAADAVVVPVLDVLQAVPQYC